MKSEIATVSTYGGATASVFFGLTLNEWGVLVGIFVAIAGFGYNVWSRERLIKIAKSKGVTMIEE